MEWPLSGRVDWRRQWEFGVSHWLMSLRQRVRKLEAEVKASSDDSLALVEAFARRAKVGAVVTRDEAAAFLAVDAKQLVRWEAAGRIQRLKGYGIHVRFNPGDVLKLASADRKEE